MTIHDVEDFPILQVSSQEPSVSSKYDFEDRGVLEALLIMLESWNLVHKSRITYHDDPWWQMILGIYVYKFFRISFQGYSKMIQCIKDDPILEVSSQEPSMSLQVWTLMTGGSWHTSNYAREPKFGTQANNHIAWHTMTTRMRWPHPPNLQSGTFYVLQVWLGGQWLLNTLLFIVESINWTHK